METGSFRRSITVEKKFRANLTLHFVEPWFLTGGIPPRGNVATLGGGHEMMTALKNSYKFLPFSRLLAYLPVATDHEGMGW